MRLYTGRGDDGTTDLLGARVDKDDPRIDALGALDEATSTIGLGRAADGKRARCVRTCSRCSVISTASWPSWPSRQSYVRPRIDLRRRSRDLAWSETDDSSASVELPREFILPGRITPGAALDVARTVARRAERQVVALNHAGHTVNAAILSYSNRLSSLLFIAAQSRGSRGGEAIPSGPKLVDLRRYFEPSPTRAGMLPVSDSRELRREGEVRQSMRMSHLFGRTLREAPGDVELPSHQLMLRAAMIRPLGAGIFSLLPLGWRVVRKIEQIIREEMDAIGGQEM